PRHLRSFPTRRSSDLLDPFFTPPAALEFFEQVRQENEERLAPIREQRRLAKQARAAEEAARRRFLEERARERESRAPPTVRYLQDRKSTRLNSSHVKI